MSLIIKKTIVEGKMVAGDISCFMV